jgi:hypothetical protein
MRARLVLFLVSIAACGDGDGDPRGAADAGAPDAATGTHRLEDFLPPLPEPTGGARTVHAGVITSDAELVAGPARSGLRGDYFMRNARARFVIQAAGRSVGIVPFGGNLVDAVPVGPDGKDTAGDHFGELGMVYLIGRACEHSRVEVVRDGSGGGAAVIRATGRTAVNDYINLRALGLLPVSVDINPDIPDRLACASTYVLESDTPELEVTWTFYNPELTPFQGPMGMLNDGGGEIQVFSPVLGFSHLQGGIDQLTGGADTSVPYQVYQAADVAYGLLPILPAGSASAGLVVSGAAVLVFNARTFLDVNRRAADLLHIPADAGFSQKLRFIVARDGVAVDAAYHRSRGTSVTPVSGALTFQPSGVPARARVTVFRDVTGDGALGDDDLVLTYLEADAEGRVSGALPAGDYLVRADVPDVARSAAARLTVGASPVTLPALALPDPARVDFTVVDDATGAPVPAKLTVIGRHPAPRDFRANQTYEGRFGIVRALYAVNGSSVPESGPGDAPILLPAGGPYRLYASRGPEWSVASAPLTLGTGERVTLPPLRLRRVLDTTGYIATTFHEHAVGSPDSAVSFEDRIATLVVEGIELASVTEHDRLVDYDPVIARMGLEGTIDAVVGIESTPFAYGHFNAYPLAIDPEDPSGGAVDWGRGPTAGLAMLPGEIFDAFRARGARVVQVNHPRSSGVGGFQAYFTRSGMTVDFAARTIASVAANQDIPTEWLRLPSDEPLFDDDFDAIETWISFGRNDSDGDGVRDIPDLDTCLRDYMNFLSLGKIVTPLANGDTHTRERDVAGLPRTLVRVPDDGEDALRAGVEEETWRTLLGEAPRDVVVTNGPMIRVSGTGEGRPPVAGTTVQAEGGAATFEITASVAGWSDVDTIEVFANATFDRLQSGQPTTLRPLRCFTSRTQLAPTDPCLGGGPLEVVTVDGRREARLTFTLRAADVPRRAGATGDDAWMIVRARGVRGLFPVIVDEAVTPETLDALIAGDTSVLAARGVSAMAYTSPVFIDFDGGGWRAPFAP